MGSKLFYSFFIMLISPVIGLVIGLQNGRRDFQKWIWILFITLYGSIILLHPGADGYVHQSNVTNYYVDISFLTFLNGAVDILTFTQNPYVQEDLYIHTVSFLVGGLLGLPKLFFVVVAFVYAYFFIGSIFEIVKLNPNFKYKKILYGFIIVFICWKSIEGINTVRTWTGLWVLFYSSIKYYNTKKFKYILLMFFPPLCHVGYFAMAMPAWFVLFFGSRKIVYSVLFAISFFMNIINPQSALTTLESTEVGETMTQGYYVEEQTSITTKFGEESTSNWYRRSFKLGIQNYATDVLAAILIIFGYYFSKMNFVESSIFSVGLLMKVLSSASWFIYALSNRSGVIAGVFILASFILLASRGVIDTRNQYRGRLENFLYKIVFVALIPLIILRVSELLDFLSIFIFSTPFLVWLFDDINMSIKDAVKLIL
jgi:hypothetical protein